MSDTAARIDELLEKVDEIARDYDSADYGLAQAILDVEEKLRAAVADVASSERAAQKEKGWKDVKKELPPPNPKKSWEDGPNFRDVYQASDTVLAFNGCITTAEALTNPKGETVWVCGDETVKGVTHWRELPSPPLRAQREG